MGSTDKADYVTLTDNPSTIFQFSGMPAAAIRAIKAAGDSNSGLSLSLSGTNNTGFPFDPPWTSLFQMNSMIITGGNPADSYVNGLLLIKSSGTNIPSGPNYYEVAFANIGGTTSGLLTTTQQVAIAAISLAGNKPITYTTGNTYFYSHATN